MSRIRVLVAGVLAATAVAACSSSTGGTGNTGGGNTGGGGATGSSGGGNSANFCQRLGAADQKLTKLGGLMAHPQSLASRLNPVIAAFQSLKAGAPPKVASAIDDLLTAMQDGQKALQGGNPQAAEQQMMKLAPKLQHDAGVIGQYVAKQCGGG